MRRYLFGLILISILYSCKQDQSNTFYQNCDSISDYKGASDLYKWDVSTTENDTAFVQVFFDTIMFDEHDILNTITYSWFRDKVSEDFDWSNYISSETVNISNEFELQEKGQYFENNYSHYWFVVKDNNLTSYIEYITTNPLTIKQINTSSNIQKLKDMYCNLRILSTQAKPLSP